MTQSESSRLISLVAEGWNEHAALESSCVGVKYSGQKVRSFFDGYGALRFATTNNILINPTSDPRMEELIEYSVGIPADHELGDLFAEFHGSLDDLYNTVKKSWTLAPTMHEGDYFHPGAPDHKERAKNPNRAASRRGARKGKSKRDAATRAFARSAKGSVFHRRLGRYLSRKSDRGYG